jgi:hypothetical protein
VYYQQPNYDN